MPTIIFVIDKEGNVVNEVMGGSGASCDIATGPYSKALGGEEHTEHKEEYYEEENNNTHIKIGT